MIRNRPRGNFTSGSGRLRLLLEELERRCLPSGGPWPAGFQPVPTAGTNVTLDQAQGLQALAAGSQAGATGTIGAGPAGAADVYYYRFTLGRPERVHLETFDLPQGRHLNAVLSLYNTDPLDPLGHHLLAQDDGGSRPGGYAALDQTLGAGTYFLAVGGSGDDYFNPYLVGSGYFGATGDFAVRLTAADAGIEPGDGPAVLAASAASVDGALLAGVPLPINPPPVVGPADVQHLSASPYLLRVELSGSVDCKTLLPDTNVLLNYSPTGDFSGPDQFTQLTGIQVNYDDAPGEVKELQVTPPAPLGPGYYRLVVLGNTADARANPGLQTVLDAGDVNALGMNGAHPTGQDYTFAFRVIGSEGVPGAAAGAVDTPATARDLGSVAGAGRVRVTGVVGDDPTDPAGFNPSAVDLYHFRVVGTGNFAFAAEVFAGRIGSTLEPSLSLFRVGAGGRLEFVAGNRDTNNTTRGSDGSLPLQHDAVLFAGLTGGDYYLAVSSGRNLPDPAGGHPQGVGVFDPAVSHSGAGGNSTGPYVLNLQVEPSSYPPNVLATSLADGASLAAPPTALTVRFDRPVNVQQFAFAATAQGALNQVKPVYIARADGQDIYPGVERVVLHFVSYDPADNQADFQLLVALPDGSYVLHLSGPDGLTDLAGNPLVGNDPSGDYLVRFTVDGPARGTPGAPTAWVSRGPNDRLTAPQDLGVLFPQELHATVTISGSSAPGAANYYQFTLLQPQAYYFTLTTSPNQSLALALYAGGVVATLDALPDRDGTYRADLQPGTYVLGVTWDAGAAAPVTYQVAVSVTSLPETATPLQSGPAPALRLQLVSNVPPPNPPPVTAPPNPPPPPMVTAHTVRPPDPPPPPPDVTVPAPPDPVMMTLVPLVVITPSAPVVLSPAADVAVTSGTTQTIALARPPAAPPVDNPVLVSPAASPSVVAVASAMGSPVVAAPAAPQVVTQAPAPAPVINPARVPVLPPYLSQALAEGPLGGVRGRETSAEPLATGPSPAAAGASSSVAAFTSRTLSADFLLGGTPERGQAPPTGVEDGGRGQAGGEGATWIRPASFLPTTFAAAFDFSGIPVRPDAAAEAIVRGGVRSAEALDDWWPSFRPTLPTPPARAPSEHLPPESDAGAIPEPEGVEASAAAPEWSSAFSCRLVRWGTVAVLGLGWGVWQGKQVWDDRKERRSLRCGRTG